MHKPISTAAPAICVINVFNNWAPSKLEKLTNGQIAKPIKLRKRLKTMASAKAITGLRLRTKYKIPVWIKANNSQMPK